MYWESALHTNITISLDKMEWGNMACSRSQLFSAGMSKMQGFFNIIIFFALFLLPKPCVGGHMAVCAS